MNAYQSVMLDPGAYLPLIDALPASVPALVATVQHLLVHTDWLAEYSLDLPPSRGTLPAAERLSEILQKCGDPLDVARPPPLRAVGTCRDYALLLCVFLRAKGIDARVRCGFASYFGEGWEDHWICEYRPHPGGDWAIADAQLDSVMRDRLAIDFDPAEVPSDRFVSAGKAWLDYRAGGIDAKRFGHGDVTGPWFMKVNVVRDHHAVTGRIVSPWDRWREAPVTRRIVQPDEVGRIDLLARQPESETVDWQPEWLAVAGEA